MLSAPLTLHGLDREDILLRHKLNIVFGDAFDGPKTYVGEHPPTPTRRACWRNDMSLSSPLSQKEKSSSASSTARITRLPGQGRVAGKTL